MQNAFVYDNYEVFDPGNGGETYRLKVEKYDPPKPKPPLIIIKPKPRQSSSLPNLTKTLKTIPDPPEGVRPSIGPSEPNFERQSIISDVSFTTLDQTFITCNASFTDAL